MIILYHKVDIEHKSIWYVTADTFDNQMAALQAYDVVYLDDYDPENPRHVVITFDGIYEDVWRYAARILEKWGYPYELFVIGDHIGGNNAFDTGEPLERFADVDMLADLSRRGARIQWHTASHRPMDSVSHEELLRELRVPSELTARFPSPHFRWFAYPHDIDRSADPDGKIASNVKQHFAGALAVLAGSTTDRYRLNRLTAFEKTVLPSSKVSIIIANYNYGRFLAEAIDSVLRQTHPPDEILLIDDASTDESRSVIDAFSDRLTVELNERNLGIVENFRKAVSLTTGDYVGFLGADNRMRSDYVERTRAALDANPEAAVAYTDMTIFGPLAGLLASKSGATQSQVEGLYHWQFPDPTPDVVANIHGRNFIHGSSLFRRSWYDRVGGYRTSSNAEDHDLFRRMLQDGGGAVRVPHRLIEYRQHSQEQANTVLNLQLRISTLERKNRELREALAQRSFSPTSAKTIFELVSSSQDVCARLGTLLTWTDEGLEIEATNDDPGLVISLGKNASNWIGLRAVYRSDRVGCAQVYSRTSDETTYGRESQILHSIKKGWNFLSLSMQREANIQAVRFDPSDRPGHMLLQEFVIYTI